MNFLDSGSHVAFILQNDGKGNFSKTEIPNLPTSSGGCVVANDYDQNGDVNLFIGGRVVPRKYPKTPASSLMVKFMGKDYDYADKLAGDLAHNGMVTDAIWADFDNDKKDAGELGAGHTVTAIYEIIPMTGKRKMDKGVDALKYQAYGSPVEAYSGELATVKLRYKKPQGKRSSLLEVPVLDILTDSALTSNNMRWAMAMAQFGLTVRRSKHLKDYDS